MLGYGVLSIDEREEAMFFEGNGERGSRVLAVMQRIRIESATANGITLSGMEPINSGAMKFNYQEWWLAYLDADSTPPPSARP